jgi:superfamily II DNA/RNA helicase
MAFGHSSIQLIRPATVCQMLDCVSSFHDYGLHPAIVQGLEDTDHFRSTDIQDKAMKYVHSRGPAQGLILMGPSGTGKTCAFSILLLEHLAKQFFTVSADRPPPMRRGSILGLILAPAPELCHQIAREMQSIGRHLPLLFFAIVNSIKLEEDWESVAGSHVVIATPGITLKLVRKRKLNLSCLLVLVIDEWDKMLSDQGLSNDLKELLRQPSPDLTRYICASATFSEVAYSTLSTMFPVAWRMEKSAQYVHRSLHHFAFRAGKFERRIQLLIMLMQSVPFHQALVFCNLHQYAKDAEKSLNSAGFPAAFVSSQDDQQERLDRIAEFRDIQLRCLIATDIIARGIDIMNVNLVVSLDFPHENTTMLHRIGRTGRFMSDGLSLMFFKKGEGKMVRELSKSLDVTFEPLDFTNLPDVRLPQLRNETQIENFARLRKIQSEAAEMERREIGVPLMPFCDMTTPYWANYQKVCAELAPRFA